MATVYENVAVVKHGYVQSITTGINGPEEVVLNVYYEGQRPEECGYSPRGFKVSELFTDEAEAQKVADAHTAKQVERFVKDKKERHRSWAWHVSYHRKQIREAQRQIEYATEQLAYAQSKAKK
jgi:hypothetical protein